MDGYDRVGDDVALPKIYYFGKCGKYNALVMDLLGPNLEVGRFIRNTFCP